MDQAVGRAVRIGQKDIVEVTLLVLKEEDSMNIDETMLQRVEEKRGMLEKVFQHASRGALVAQAEAEAEAEAEEDPVN
jgi:SNF2 family DNA or RNA helicase